MSIKAENIYFRYGSDLPYVIEDLSGEFERGRITAIMGPNGSGKTTFSKILLGILKPEKGKVTIDGQDVKELSLAQAGRKIGYVMQNPARQIFSPTVREEMAFGLENLGLGSDEINRRTDLYLEYFDIAQYKEEFPFLLSKGEKQRLILAAVLAMEPDYLMLDEPTAALDMKRKKILGDHLLKIKEDKGTGIVIISHDRDFVERYGDCRVIIEKGDGGEAHV